MNAVRRLGCTSMTILRNDDMYWTERGMALDKVKFIQCLEKKKTGVEFYNDNIMCFDIETSSGFYNPETDTVEEFNKHESAEHWKGLEKVSLVYVWQFAIDYNVYMGRTLEDFLQFLLDLDYYEPHQKFIYVHNLGFEFQFLRNILPFDKVFAREPRKPMYATYLSYTFRCSYFLSVMSLDKWGKSYKAPHQKKVGDLEYTTIRTPLTELTEKEKDYAINDVLVMVDCLNVYKDMYETVKNIPLTQTGRVRRKVIEIMKPEYKARKQYRNLIPKTIEEYSALCDVFAGGYTHANFLHSKEVLTSVSSKDIASSYPYAMVIEKYPMTTFCEINYNDRYLTPEWSAIMIVEFYNITSVRWNSYISFSKCHKINQYQLDNGRVLKASYICIAITNIDYEIIKQCYKWDDMRVLSFKVAHNGYLSDTFCKYILELFYNKTTLDGITEEESRYMESKQFINSLYGMMVTKEETDKIIYSDEWHKEPLTGGMYLTDIARKKRGNPEKIFNAFQWGVWVTAYARRNLWTAILALDEDVVYCDTDSVKYLNNHDDFFIEYNKNVEIRENDRAEQLNVSRETFSPTKPDGKVKRLGTYEDEGIYQEFITLGAKKYCYRKNNKLHMTVSGVRKDAVSQLNNDIHNFDINTEFDIDHTKKVIMHYNDNQPKVIWKKGECDEFTASYKYGICAQPTTYCLGMTADYLELCISSGMIEESEVIQECQKKNITDLTT